MQVQSNRILIQVLGLNILALVGTIAVSAPFGQVYRQFEDGGFVTYFSVIQLFIASYFAYKIFKIREKPIKHPWKSPVAIWGFISLGFSFLALDDLLMIHEWLDKVIHSIGQIEETGASDRIDDLIVGGYGIIALGLLVHYRRELKKYRNALPYVVIAFILLFSMVGVDALTNRDDLLLMVFSPAVTANIMGWVFIPEEAFKIISEAFFIVSAHSCYHTAKKLALQTAVPATPLRTIASGNRIRN
ncbi:MAG: hypothetical protein AAFQ40_16080 [Cyanobacteria bacterium J06623_5]